MAAHTKIDLYQMQSLPLDAKIRMTARRIDAFIDRNDAYLSISGGKDSRVLDDIERRFVRAKLPRVFIDTGLEHRSVRACGKKHADIILRPEKNFKQIITEYGYPVISKEVAQTIAEARKGLKNGNCYTYRMAKLNGTAVDKNGDKSKYNIPQYKFLLDAPFRISHKCCDYMKKKPAKQYEKETGRLPIVATMAEESNLRLQKWLKHGCNAFDLKRPMSAPMSFWSENDVLEYLFKYELDYAECYGKIIPKLDKEQIEGQITIYEATNDYRGCQFCTTGCKRTGCIFCLFGILQDKERIIKLEKEDTPNALQMQHIQENVCTHFGTNMDILQNKFDENTWNAYYEGKIEPFAIQLSLVMTNMSFTERERACGNAIFFSANRLQYASNATKLSVSTQLFDRALLNRNGVMDIWNMAHVEDGEKYYIRKEYTEVSELHKGSEQPVIIQQVPQQTEPAAGEEPQNGQEEKEGVNNAS